MRSKLSCSRGKLRPGIEVPGLFILWGAGGRVENRLASLGGAPRFS